MPPTRLPSDSALSAPSRRILCVDGDADHRRALCVALAGPGTIIECVNATAEAIYLLTCDAAEWHLLVVSDCPPEVDAMKLLRHGRAAGFEGPIILLGAHDSPRAHTLSQLQPVVLLPRTVPPRQLRVTADAFIPHAV